MASCLLCLDAAVTAHPLLGVLGVLGVLGSRSTVRLVPGECDVPWFLSAGWLGSAAPLRTGSRAAAGTAPAEPAWAGQHRAQERSMAYGWWGRANAALEKSPGASLRTSRLRLGPLFAGAGGSSGPPRLWGGFVQVPVSSQYHSRCASSQTPLLKA